MKSRLLRTFAVAVSAVAFAAPARADGTPPQTDREKALEKRVDELARQLEEVNRKLADRGTSKSGDELDARVTELEKLTKKDKDGLFPYWNNGIRMDSANGAFKLKIGGLIQNDWTWFWNNQKFEDETGDQIQAGEEFRRARLSVGGTMYKNVEFMAEYDFAGGSAQFKNVWMALIVPCIGRVQVGSMKEPFGLEQLTSSRDLTFIERSAGSDAFTPAFNTGIQVSNTYLEERGAWAVGVFRNADNFGNDTGNSSDGEYNLTGRVTGRPWIDKDANRYLHLGVGGSLRNPSNDSVTFMSRPEMRLAPFAVNTTALSSDRVDMGEGEVGFVTGPLHASGEYYLTKVRGTEGGPDATFHAWTAQAGWFITGESRPYRVENGTFGRVSPKKNYDGEGGSGALEAAIRYDRIDLDDGGVEGGQMNTMTLGINWYLNPNTKVMLDWVRAHREEWGTLDGLVVRFQVDF